MTDEPKALPPAQSHRLVDAGAVLAIAKDMTAKNWKAKRDDLCKLLDSITESVIMGAQTGFDTVNAGIRNACSKANR